MPPITFRFVAFESDLLHPASPLPDDPIDGEKIGSPSRVLVFEQGERNVPVVRLTKRSPPEVEEIRPLLETRVYTSPDLSHDAFGVFNVIHDDVDHFDAYPISTGDAMDGDMNEMVRQWYAKAIRFVAYELNNERGLVYATTTENVLKEMFRRHRAANGDGAVLRRRVVDIRALEGTLRSQMGAEANRYKFKNVRSDTVITGMMADGQQLNDNDEVQGIKDRAERIGEIRFDYQHENNVLRISVNESGVVGFSSDPGTQPALDLLHRLDGYIAAHSELTVVTVR